MIGQHNFVNIRYNSRNHWLGQSGNTRGFCNFISYDYCVRACLFLLCRSYRRNGYVSYSEIINRFAPPSENDTTKYVQYICDNLKCFPFDTPKSLLDYAKLIHYMGIYETGYTIHVHYILKVANFYKIKIAKVVSL